MGINFDNALEDTVFKYSVFSILTNGALLDSNLGNYVDNRLKPRYHLYKQTMHIEEWGDAFYDLQFKFHTQHNLRRLSYSINCCFSNGLANVSNLAIPEISMSQVGHGEKQKRLQEWPTYLYATNVRIKFSHADKRIAEIYAEVLAMSWRSTGFWIKEGTSSRRRNDAPSYVKFRNITATRKENDSFSISMPFILQELHWKEPVNAAAVSGDIISELGLDVEYYHHDADKVFADKMNKLVFYTELERRMDLEI